MKKINITIELYSYEELNEKAREKAFNKYYEFLSAIPIDYEEEDENGNIIKKEEWIENWKDDEIKSHVEESININEYLFFENGEMADITHYTGKHEKAGKTEFKFLNKVYEVEE